MFEIQNYYSFIVAICLFQLFPGAGTVAILSATATHGPQGGMSAVFGTLAGDFIFMSSAVLGLATILSSHPLFFAAIQYFGVMYLCYLGMRYLFIKAGDSSRDSSHTWGNVKSFQQALAVCLTNPKAIMFFMAFFPLFLRADSRPATLVIMMMHVTFISLVYQSLLVLVGNAVAKYISRWKYMKVIALRMAGITLIVFGLKLAKSIR